MNEFRAAERLIYLSEFSDEVMPCAPRLDAWAKWLNAPVDPTWEGGPPREIADGETFEAFVLELHASNLIATWRDTPDACGWTHPAPPPGADFFAVAISAGARAWGPDAGDHDLAALLSRICEAHDEVEIIVGRDASPVRVRFTRNPDGTATCAVVDPSQEH